MSRSFYHGTQPPTRAAEKRAMRIRFDGFDLFLLFAAVAITVLLLALLTAGCAPATDLTGAAGAGEGSADGAGPGGGALVDPAAGTSDVPTNLAAILLRFPAPVMLAPQSLRVCDGAAAPPVVSAAEEVPCDDGACYRAALGAPLPVASSCRVALGAGVVDAGGRPVGAGIIGVFDTAIAPDGAPPVIDGFGVEQAGPCLAVRFSTDEPATGAVVLRAGEVERVVPAGAGQTSFDVAVPAATLPPEVAATVSVRATDRAGNVAESAPLSLTTPPLLPPVAITEVLANPAGTEPAQEYVELRNLGDAPVSLEGMQLQDSRAGDPLPAGVLAPGAYALVVTATYDVQGGADPPPRPGTLLLRVDGRIGADGLSNGGEPVRLVIGDTLLSSYGGWVDVSSATWSGKATHRLVQSACDRASAWNRTPLAPTPGWGPP
jgi:hypothetical protein